jgi:hypothetical protein
MKLRNCTVGSPDYPRPSGADGKLFLPSSFASSLFAVAAYLTHADKLVKRDHHNDHHDKRVEFRHTAVWIHRRVSYSIRRSQAARCELDLSVWLLPPMLNNRHITAMRNLIDDFACLEASRFYR